MNVSDRIRPNSEAAPWVIEQVKKLKAEVKKLRLELEKALCEVLIADEQIAQLERKLQTMAERLRYSGPEGARALLKEIEAGPDYTGCDYRDERASVRIHWIDSMRKKARIALGTKESK